MKWILLLITIVFISTITIYHFNFYQIQESSKISGESVKPVSIKISRELNEDKDSKNLKILNPPVNNIEVVKLFESLKTAEDIIVLANSLLSEGRDGLAKEILKYLHARCGHLEGYEPAESTWSNQLYKYCESYDRNQYEYIKDITVEKPLKIPDFHLLASDESIENIQEASDGFIALLSQIESRSALVSASNAIMFFSNELGIPLQLGQDNDLINPLDFEYVQDAALNLYACEVFGGCGSNDYLTLEICIITNQCQPGWTMYDFYQNTLSPIYFDQVISILNHLRSRIPGP